MQTKDRCERAVQTEGRKLEGCADNGQDFDAPKAVQAEGSTPRKSTNKGQDADKQGQHNGDNTIKLSVITNPMGTGTNNNENSFLLELTINENQSFISDQLREDDMVANIKHVSQKDNINSERFISNQSKDPDMGAKTIQIKKKRKQKKKEFRSWYFWEQ